MYQKWDKTSDQKDELGKSIRKGCLSEAEFEQRQWGLTEDMG